jgi:hypothetical protein
MTSRILIAYFAFSFALHSAAQNTEPAILGEGIISTSQDEFGGSLSPDGKTIYFDRSVPPHYLYTMWESHLIGGQMANAAAVAILRPVSRFGSGPIAGRQKASLCFGSAG